LFREFSGSGIAVRKGFAMQPQEWPWSSYNNFALDQEQIKHCRMRIDDVYFADAYRG
jgi:hypothetical protein